MGRAGGSKVRCGRATGVPNSCLPARAVKFWSGNFANDCRDIDLTGGDAPDRTEPAETAAGDRNFRVRAGVQDRRRRPAGSHQSELTPLD